MTGALLGFRWRNINSEWRHLWGPHLGSRTSAGAWKLNVLEKEGGGKEGNPARRDKYRTIGIICGWSMVFMEMGQRELMLAWVRLEELAEGTPFKKAAPLGTPWVVWLPRTTPLWTQAWAFWFFSLLNPSHQLISFIETAVFCPSKHDLLITSSSLPVAYLLLASSTDLTLWLSTSFYNLPILVISTTSFSSISGCRGGGQQFLKCVSQ